MHDNSPEAQVQCAAAVPAAFTTTVALTPRGEWVTTVDLGDGISMSKLFDDEDEACRYAIKMTEWLRTGRSEQTRPMVGSSLASPH